mmetsp:Transcript_5568/g.11724  ORF Transcript_5568/g.11724 Transcript_5568/m.11724 type:complete len:269 (+) Transcript_5568:78-884(+)
MAEQTEFQQKYGPWALITGATSGIGAEFADQIAAKGLKILLVARKEAELKEQAKKLAEKHKVETSYLSADLATTEGVEKIKAVEQEIGLLVPCAGLEQNGAFEKSLIEKERMVLTVNVVSTFELVRHFGKSMISRGHGGILLVGSMIGQMPCPYFSNYSGTKAYITMFGASLYAEFKPKGVDVTVLSPGLTATSMVADNGVDFSKTSFSAMDPAEVAASGLDGLGKRPLTTPGMKNQLMVAAVKMLPIKMAAESNEAAMRVALDPEKL